jgi:glycosyltransferase involved in cell wall biosynthesis
MLKKISVITINYNNCRGLIKTYDSLRVQEDLKTRVEWIVVDGNSTDGSVDFLKSISFDIDKLTIESDKGIYDAMNKGLAAATGEYVWFLNSGDSFYNNLSVDRVCNSIELSNADVLFGDTMFVSESGNIIGLISKLKPQRLPSKLTFNGFKYGMNVCHQSVIVKREICPKYNLEYKLAADIDWILEILKHQPSSNRVEYTLSNFEVGGSSYQHTKKAWKERFKVFSKHYGIVPNLINHVWIIVRRIIFDIKIKVFNNK